MQLLDGEEFNFKERNLKLHVSLQNKAVNVYGDPMLIARALSNLISNVLKYLREATTVNISLKELVVNKINYSIFTIYNIPREAISEEEANNLFSRLYKLDKSRNDEGSGLGLAITQEIIKAHNGMVKVETIEGIIRFSVMFSII
ncbi:ATP-binding protein [Clostridium tarantellae]|uniref:histidine kinase n=1 Tax=Clostridium tarantellae TaxID=39493 RepID=A0A6I1MTF1_9CLOT|nr:ATP-binding protein [Clostridium tarantellae]MPQ43519.1 GHKL domain-containing protein [Clostridium tarantellae]